MKILLGVSGSISAYKALDLTRELSKKGHEVKIILTQGALKFVVSNTFRYLGAKEVYAPNDDFNFEKYKTIEGNVLHIDLINWADQFVIYPTSANTIAKLSHGSAHDLLTSCALAWKEHKLLSIFPAMNTQMLEHPFTQESLKKLSALKWCRIYSTLSGELACGENGTGKLIKPEQAIHLIEASSLKQTNKTVLITTGASIAPLDDVRYLTNPSSGSTGFEIAKVFLAKGHKVHILAGKFATKDLDMLSDHPNYKLERLNTTKDFNDRVLQLINSSQLYISSAALCDLSFNYQQGKIKKSSLNKQLDFETEVDVLSNVIKNRSDSLKIIGFAAEASFDKENINEKLNRKPVDLLVHNIVSSGVANDMKGFSTADGEYTFIDKNHPSEQQKLTKSQLAVYLSEWYENN